MHVGNRRHLQTPKWGHTGYWKGGCPNRFSRKFYEAEHYRRRFKPPPSRLEGHRGLYYCYSGIYKRIGLEQRVLSGGWKTDTRGFIAGRLSCTTRKCTHILRHGTRNQWPFRGVIRCGMGRKSFVAKEKRLVPAYHKTNVLGLQQFLRVKIPT